MAAGQEAALEPGARTAKSARMTHPADTAPPPALAPLVDVALAAGDAILRIYATDFAVESKNDDSPVSAADREAEAIIIERLGRAFPDIPLVAEEAVAAGRIPQTGARFFLVDPLDGTREFVGRNGEFTVNIALVENGIPTMGVVTAPALGRAYAGIAGTGAWSAPMGGEPLACGPWAPITVRRSADRPKAVASRSHATPATESMLSRFAAGERCAIGSSLKFCLLAEGSADFYPRLGPTMEWDTAAGDAVLRAAGGLVVTLDGSPLAYGKRGVPGMREFENPFFVAAGDRRLLDRLAPAVAG